MKLPLVCLVCLALGWAVVNFMPDFDIDFNFDWYSILDAIYIKEHGKFTALFLFGCVLIFVVFVLRILRGSRNDD